MACTAGKKEQEVKLQGALLTEMTGTGGRRPQPAMTLGVKRPWEAAEVRNGHTWSRVGPGWKGEWENHEHTQ